MLTRFLGKSSYREVDTNDLCFEADSRPKIHHRSRFGPAWPWVCSTFIFGLGLAALFIDEHAGRRPFGTFEHGFNTELGTATHVIGLEKIDFTGNIRFRPNSNRTAYESYIFRRPGTKQYAGSPSEEIDGNWQALIRDRYFWVTEEEAASMWPDELDALYHREGKGYVAGLDVLHTLHCVDMMRMLLDPQHYPEALRMSQNHNYHCIDHLRQYLMCTGDLTPVPTKWIEGVGQLYVDSDRPHTCRNFQNVLDWVKTREIVYSIDEP